MNASTLQYVREGDGGKSVTLGERERERERFNPLLAILKTISKQNNPIPNGKWQGYNAQGTQREKLGVHNGHGVRVRVGSHGFQGPHPLMLASPNMEAKS
jgi:hypothetical protein